MLTAQISIRRYESPGIQETLGSEEFNQMDVNHSRYLSRAGYSTSGLRHFEYQQELTIGAYLKTMDDSLGDPCLIGKQSLNQAQSLNTRTSD